MAQMGRAIDGRSVDARTLGGMSDATTIGDKLQDALVAYEQLVSLAEEIDDEWTYVNDLSEAWREQVQSVLDERGTEPADSPRQAAVDGAIDEIGRISDPHRAIDWLSTFPQIVLAIVAARA